MSRSDSLDELQARLKQFAEERSWGRYHTPKNLTAAIAGEAGELAAVLQWATPEEPIGPYRGELEDEIADILIYLVRLCDVTGVDPITAANVKVDRNIVRFPPGGSGPDR
jgi:NTP pyrophosphatase (non-canonical NTP hydrolase)